MCSFGCRFGSSVIPTTLGLSTRPYRNVRNMFSRRGLMHLWVAFVMASADDGACALQKPLRKHKIRDNYLYFDGPSIQKVQSVQFEETSHSITDGQPYGGVFSLGTYLDVRAGRHESEEVANDFNAGVTPDNARGLCLEDPNTPLPAELNFAVFGTLSVTIGNTTHACPEMRIAQGHYPGTNNWWIAGTNCYHTDDDLQGLTCPCGQDPIFPNVTFFYGGGCDALAVRTVQFEK